MPPERKWTDFEMSAVLALFAQGHHRDPGGVMSFATRLNEALNPGHQYENDIDVEDIAHMLKRVHMEKKAAVAFIDRQGARRITRTMKRVFARNLDFDGSLGEWDLDGRQKREKERHLEYVSQWRERKSREAKRESADVNANAELHGSSYMNPAERYSPQLPHQPMSSRFNTQTGFTRHGGTPYSRLRDQGGRVRSYEKYPPPTSQIRDTYPEQRSGQNAPPYNPTPQYSSMPRYNPNPAARTPLGTELQTKGTEQHSSHHPRPLHLGTLQYNREPTTDRPEQPSTSGGWTHSPKGPPGKEQQQSSYEVAEDRQLHTPPWRSGTAAYQTSPSRQRDHRPTKVTGRRPEVANARIQDDQARGSFGSTARDATTPRYSRGNGHSSLTYGGHSEAHTREPATLTTLASGHYGESTSPKDSRANEAGAVRILVNMRATRTTTPDE